jgi:hypothetical protein
MKGDIDMGPNRGSGAVDERGIVQDDGLLLGRGCDCC